MSLTGHLEELKRKHAAIAKQVEDAERTPGADALSIRDMKKEKLRLKEEIERLAVA
jgi:hypothetical protein